MFIEKDHTKLNSLSNFKIKGAQGVGSGGGVGVVYLFTTTFMMSFVNI